jgi:excisionase family DNA binding protein
MAMRGEKKLLTASDLASLCQVDLKTIHNWVDRGRIAHFRTPGRHLRFRAADVADFLRTWGYSVPRELARASSRSVAFVGAADAMASVSRALSGVTARHLAHPYDALVFAGADPPDVYVVDVASVTADIDVNRMFEVLHRANPQAMLVALCEDLPGMPSFVVRISRSDIQGLSSGLASDRGADVQAPASSASRAEDEEPVRR